MTDQQAQSVKKVDKIVKLIQSLSAQDLLNVKNVANEQKWYTHPFKNAKARKINEAGVRNEAIAVQLETLRKLAK